MSAEKEERYVCDVCENYCCDRAKESSDRRILADREKLIEVVSALHRWDRGDVEERVLVFPKEGDGEYFDCKELLALINERQGK
jgi:hypothetical protein